MRIWLSNLPSHKTPGQHGPGVKLCAMAAPREHERTQDGDVSHCCAPERSYLVALHEGRVTSSQYRDHCIELFNEALALKRLTPGLMKYLSNPDREGGGKWTVVPDGATLFCACGKPSVNRKGGCHLELLAPILVRAGWEVTLWGQALARAEDGSVVTDFGWAQIPYNYKDTGW